MFPAQEEIGSAVNYSDKKFPQELLSETCNYGLNFSQYRTRV
jgi:hypothetical protein